MISEVNAYHVLPYCLKLVCCCCTRNGWMYVHFRSQRICRYHPAVQDRPDQQCASLVGSVAEWWHLSLLAECLRSDSLVSKMDVIVSQTWREPLEMAHDTHCVSFELAEERHSTVPPGRCTSKPGQARLQSRSSGKQLTDVSTTVLERGQVSTATVCTRMSCCDGDRTRGQERERQLLTPRKRLESCAERELKAMQRLSAGLAYLTTRAVSGDLMAGKKGFDLSDNRFSGLKYLLDTSRTSLISHQVLRLMLTFGLHSDLINFTLLHEPYQRVLPTTLWRILLSLDITESWPCPGLANRPDGGSIGKHTRYVTRSNLPKPP